MFVKRDGNTLKSSSTTHMTPATRSQQVEVDLQRCTWQSIMILNSLRRRSRSSGKIELAYKKVIVLGELELCQYPGCEHIVQQTTSEIFSIWLFWAYDKFG